MAPNILTLSAGATAAGILFGIFTVKALSTRNKKIKETQPGTKSHYGWREIGESYSEPAKHAILKQAQVFFRHGCRTPVNNIDMPSLGVAKYDAKVLLPDLPYTMFNYEAVDMETGGPKEKSKFEEYYKKTILPGGISLGQLTTVGQVDTYNLGRKLKKDYILTRDFLDEKFDPKDVYIRSTNVDRTIKSLRCVMSGLYGAENLGKDEPVRIDIAKLQDEMLLPNTNTCHVLRQINHNAMIHAPDTEELVPHRKHIEQAFGIYVEEGGKKSNFIDIRDQLVCRESHGLGMTQSSWVMWDKVNIYASKIMYYAVCGQHEAERQVAMQLSSGQIFDMVLNNVKKAEEKSKDNKKLYLYSTHDSTLVGMLGVLDLFDETWPPFAADLRFELYEDTRTKETLMRVVYLGKGRKVRGCDSDMCPIDQFRKAIKPYIISKKEFKETCDSDILEKIAKEMVEQEVGEVETEETKRLSDTPSGL